ncbi:MAG TPA: FAD/NAD(P)-binding protein [Patescibacteria group bacterium]|nr:FAD/NAD(P)-binding protein [Patescibacteria group bacterium]
MADSEDKNPIVVVGGGFAGTTLLTHTLLRIAADPTITEPVKILMVERHQEQMHGGVAYSHGAAYKKHNLNAGANSLDMFPGGDPPEGFQTFVQYIQAKAADGHPEMLDNLINPSRQLVHAYITDMLEIAKEKAGAKVDLEVALRKATHIEEKPDGGAIIEFGDGSSVECCHAILATGFQEAVAPRFAQKAADHPHFMDAPYSAKANSLYEDAVAHPNSRTLVIGTGLTAMDIAARLINTGYTGEIVMMSRRGLMHNTYEDTPPEEYLAKGKMIGEARDIDTLEISKHRPKFLEAETTAELVKTLVTEFNEWRAQGYTSPEILIYWERFVPDVCAKFPHKDLAALFADHEALITSSRVGVTPNTGITVREGMKNGQIQVAMGAIKDISPGPDGTLVATYNPAQGDISMVSMQFNAAEKRTEQASFDYVFSAMGNTSNYAMPPEHISDPLWRGLMQDGKAQPHWTKSGIAVSKDFSMLDAEGNASTSISVIGVPVAGHMMTTAYAYPHKPEIKGGKLGPNALGATTISAEIKMLLDAKYDSMVAGFRPEAPAAEQSVVRRQKILQPVR